MRRFAVLVPALAVALLGLLGAGRVGTGAVAQDATPPAEEFELPEGVTFEPLAFGLAEELPPAPAGVGLARIGFEPGAGFPIEPGDPSLALV